MSAKVSLSVTKGQLVTEYGGLSVWRLQDKRKSPPTLRVALATPTVLQFFVNGEMRGEPMLFQQGARISLAELGSSWMQLGRLGRFKVNTLTCVVFPDSARQVMEEHRAFSRDQDSFVRLVSLFGIELATLLIGKSPLERLKYLQTKGVIRGRTLSLYYSDKDGADYLAYFFRHGDSRPILSQAVKDTIRRSSQAELQIYIEQLARVIKNARTPLVRVLSAKAELSFAQEHLSGRRPPLPGNVEGFESIVRSRTHGD